MEELESKFFGQPFSEGVIFAPDKDFVGYQVIVQFGCALNALHREGYDEAFDGGERLDEAFCDLGYSLVEFQ